MRWSETTDDDDDAAPWDRSPSRRPPTVRLAAPLPKAVRSILAQRLFVEKTGLASSSLNQIKRLAAFQNPEFYKKPRLRRPTALTPRVIACAEDLPEYVALPRGCREVLASLLRGASVQLSVEDRRQAGEPLELRFEGGLTPVQEQAVQALLAHDIGVFVAPPGVGKTVVGTYLVAARARTTLVLVHRQPLLDQWIAQLSMLNETHLSRLLRAYVAHYNAARPHQALDSNSPQPRDIDLPPGGRIITFPQARGLHHRYQRAA